MQLSVLLARCLFYFSRINIQFVKNFTTATPSLDTLGTLLVGHFKKQSWVSTLFLGFIWKYFYFYKSVDTDNLILFCFLQYKIPFSLPLPYSPSPLPSHFSPPSPPNSPYGPISAQ